MDPSGFFSARFQFCTRNSMWPWASSLIEFEKNSRILHFRQCSIHVEAFCTTSHLPIHCFSLDHSMRSTPTWPMPRISFTDEGWDYERSNRSLVPPTKHATKLNGLDVNSTTFFERTPLQDASNISLMNRDIMQCHDFPHMGVFLGLYLISILQLKKILIAYEIHNKPNCDFNFILVGDSLIIPLSPPNPTSR